MTDPKDDPSWPKGLKKLLDEHGVKSLAELVQKKSKRKPDPPKPRLPYKDIDREEEPD